MQGVPGENRELIEMKKKGRSSGRDGCYTSRENKKRG